MAGELHGPPLPGSGRLPAFLGDHGAGEGEEVVAGSGVGVAGPAEQHVGERWCPPLHVHPVTGEVEPDIPDPPTVSGVEPVVGEYLPEPAADALEVVELTGQPYAAELPAGAEDCLLDGDDEQALTPVDTGNVCVNVDDARAFAAWRSALLAP